MTKRNQAYTDTAMENSRSYDMREVISDEMYRQKMTVYPLNLLLEELDHKISSDCLYRYLSGRTKLNSETLGMVCTVLDLRLSSPAGRNKKKKG